MISYPDALAIVARAAFAMTLSVSPMGANAGEARDTRGDAVVCADAARAVERRHGYPLAMLRAMALAETGRWNPEIGAGIAWPWTISAHGDGRFFATKAAAIAHVRALQRDGVRNIDVGCMQINLMYHADAFDSLDDAFDPARNAAYAGEFLSRLYQRSRSWSRAIALYHSGDRGKGQAYRRKVEKLWNDVRARVFEQARRERIRRFRARRAARLAARH